MATPTTLADASAQYLANADYADGAGDVTKARAFRTACRALLVLLPKSSGNQDHSGSFSPELVQAQLQEVASFLGINDAAQAPGTRVSYVDTRECRT